MISNSTGVDERGKGLPISLYAMFLRGLRSDLTTLYACSVKYRMKISCLCELQDNDHNRVGTRTVATEIAKAALFEH
jgi:hypothetical protein